MSKLYPTIEDLSVDSMLVEQAKREGVDVSQAALPAGTTQIACSLGAESSAVSLYPSLTEYMGLSLSENFLGGQSPYSSQVAIPGTRITGSGQLQLAPVSGDDVGMRKAEIKDGLRLLVLCKDQSGKIGASFKDISKGVFVSFVKGGSPAALGGLRFGDQVVQINDSYLAGWTLDKVLKFIKKADGGSIKMTVRDRPFERTVTMQKDSVGNLGFVFHDGEIKQIVKDSSAARNGLLLDHHLTEVDGQNVVGMKDKDISAIFSKSSRTVTVTVIPEFIYKHMIKSIGENLVRKEMDHSIPTV